MNNEKYYTIAKDALREAASAKRQFELDHKESMTGGLGATMQAEYDGLTRKFASCMVELLKLGENYSVASAHGENYLVLELDRKYSLSLHAVRECMDATLYSTFFPDVEEEKNAEGETSAACQEQLAAIRKDNDELKKAVGQIAEELRQCRLTLSQYGPALDEIKTRLVESTSAVTSSPASVEASIEDGPLQELLEKKDAEIATLTSLAYMDGKTPVCNANAFNRDFAAIDKNQCLLAMVSICKMRLLNETFGRQNGDNAIHRVALGLADCFGAHNVYRVLGDCFNILAVGISSNDAYSRIADLKEALAEDNIEIVFGVSAGNVCKDKGALIATVEEKMKKMKTDNGKPSSLPPIDWKTKEEANKETEEPSSELDTSQLISEFLGLPN